MRRLIPTVLILVAACQPANEPGNGESSAAETEANVAASVTPDEPGGNAFDPDTAVSSDDRQPPPPARTGDCPIVRSSDWHAHVDAMPGPNRSPHLIVTGQVTVRTGGYRLALRMGPVAESYPVQVTIYLDAVPPEGLATQALETREVHGSWQSEQKVGSVTVRCGNDVIARLSNIETAL